MQVDPKITFWLGVIVTIATGVGGGTVHLTHMIPDAWIPAVTSWNAFIAFAGSGLLTALSGISSAKSGPLTGGK